MHNQRRRAAVLHGILAPVDSAGARPIEEEDNVEEDWHSVRVSGRPPLLLPPIIANLIALSVPATAQLPADSRHPSGTGPSTTIPALVAPHSGPLPTVHGWRTGRYSATAALRMCNYNMLANRGGKAVLKLFHREPHSLLSRTHLDNRRGGRNLGQEQ